MSHPSRFTAALVLALVAATAAHAQMRRVQPSTAVKPTASTLAAQSAPNPTGLRPPVPAGLTTGSGAAVATNPVLAGNSTVAVGGTTSTTTGMAVSGGGGGTAGTVAAVSDVGTGLQTAAAATTVLGGVGARGPGQYLGSGSGYSAVDVARAFLAADANGDGELSRAEFGRISNPCMTFEEMDRNFDGVISRSEFEDACH